MQFITLKSHSALIKKLIVIFLLELCDDMERKVVFNRRKPSNEHTEKVSAKAFSLHYCYCFSFILFIVNDISCDAIAKLRRKLQRVSNNKIIFIDETHIKINEASTTTTPVAPGEKPYVVVTDSSSYAARYDMIAAIVGNKVLPPLIFTPQDRKARKANGINSEMFIDYIENILYPSISELDPCPIYLVLDKLNIYNVSKIEQAFCDVGCTELTEILIIPIQAAKRVNSLNNTLFHEWKERIRQNSLLTEENVVMTMINEWYNTKEVNIKHHYGHCAITYGQNVYKYCPFPLNHRH
jgi:hypothetical protein